MNNFFVRYGRERFPRGSSVLHVGKNLITGEADFAATHGAATTLEMDLMVLAASVFAADRATPRGLREEACRSLNLSIPVVNSTRLNPLIAKVEAILRLLSHDAWRIELRQRKGSLERSRAFATAAGKTLLFSGGLDSLAAALEFGSESAGLHLVSHRTRNQTTIRAQDGLIRLLNNSGLSLPHTQFFVSSRSGGPSDLEHDEESSQRTRSFVFLVLAALTARRTGKHEIILLAENGQLAIHLPLSTARVGAFSTHTAHPDVLAEVESLLSQALGVELSIQNPYVHRTKREVVQLIAQRLPAAIPIANSCWRSARPLGAGVGHCGECVPCIIRRIAIEGSVSQDPTTYARDLFQQDIRTLGADDDGRRNLVELAEFALRFERGTDEEIMSEWPELYSPRLNANAVIGMYRRFAGEARTVLGRYPSISAILQ